MKNSEKPSLSGLESDLLAQVESLPMERIAGGPIDRSFEVDITDLSDSELDQEIHRLGTRVNENFFYVHHRFQALFEERRLLSLRVFNNPLIKAILFPFYAAVFVLPRLGGTLRSMVRLHQVIPLRFQRMQREMARLRAGEKAGSPGERDDR